MMPRVERTRIRDLRQIETRRHSFVQYSAFDEWAKHPNEPSRLGGKTVDGCVDGHGEVRENLAQRPVADDGSFTVHGVFAVFSHCIADRLSRPLDPELQKAFEYVESRLTDDDSEMLCLQKNGHKILALQFAFSDESAKPHDFREDRILSETTVDLPIPRLRRLRLR